MAIPDPDFIWLTAARLAILLFTGLIAWMTHRSYQLLKELQIEFNVLLSLPETVARCLMVGVCLLLAWLSGLPAAALGLTVSHVGQSVALGLGIGLLTQLLVNIAALQAIKRLGPHIYSPWLLMNILPKRPIEWLWVALAFIPPILMEELLFRSLLLGVFAGLLPMWLLVGLSSIVFGLMHQPQGKLGIAMTGFINVLFSTLFLYTGELLVTLTAHYTVNMSQVVAAYLKKDWL